MSAQTKTTTVPLAKRHPQALAELRRHFSGVLDLRHHTKLLYATDASIYREIPSGVVYPRQAADLAALIVFARRTGISLIARGGGTSLAGQVVGAGLIIDYSRFMHQLIEVNAAERWVRVAPGIIRDDLNAQLRAHKLFFAPETASASRATIGGMISNNSTGANSLVYGNTRHHLIALKGYLADGSFLHLHELSPAKLQQRAAKPTNEGRCYRALLTLLAAKETQHIVNEVFPHASITRRNSGYALDTLLQTAPFTTSAPAHQAAAPFNLAQLIAGAEGTLMLITEATLRLSPLPPRHAGVIAAHFTSVQAALRANLIALKAKPHTCELIDHHIIDCTQQSLEYQEYRSFIKGRPAAILIIELRRSSQAELTPALAALQTTLQNSQLATHLPILTGSATAAPWLIRKAGLGLLSNKVGDAKPIALVEDAAVRVEDLAPFVTDFNAILKTHQLSCVYYAHAGAGELHLRPIINIKTPAGQQLIRKLALQIVELVKQYGGSLSGEHGDGRLRGEFLETRFGSVCYALFKQVKTIFDPENLFNPHKIVAAPPMNEALRYSPADVTPLYPSYLDFSRTQGMVRLAEMCNGSGECRRSHLSPGLMCPSYMATRDERHTTRARANILREMLKVPPEQQPFNRPEVLDVLDLCLSCKGCKAQCPSSVDIAALKAEYLSHYYENNAPSVRTRFFAHLPTLTAQTAFLPSWLKNSGLSLLSPLLKQLLKLNPKKSLPRFTGKSGFKRVQDIAAQMTMAPRQAERVYLFLDEYTNVFDSHVCAQSYELLRRLGYAVSVLPLQNSGRSFISAGFLKQAQQLAQRNLQTLRQFLQAEGVLNSTATAKPDLSEHFSIVGIEPSALLTWRDEQLTLLRGKQQQLATALANRTVLLEEFIFRQLKQGALSSHDFPNKHPYVVYHEHCHQQALSKPAILPTVFNLISQKAVTTLGQGCCGMAGTFGYEREHSQVSADIAALRILPALQKLKAEQPEQPKPLIVATGFSCREQLQFLGHTKAVHPCTALLGAL